MRYAQTNGYAAITSMLVITAVVVVVGTGVSLGAIGNIQSAWGSTQGEAARLLVDACVEEVLLKINKTSSVPSNVVTPEGSCLVTTNSQNGESYSLRVTATKDNHTKAIGVNIVRNTTVEISSWLEEN